MEYFSQVVANFDGHSAIAVVVGLLALWFLPALLALVFNRKQTKWIALACIPAGLSFIAWGALLVWATTGKVVARNRSPMEQAEP